MRVGTDLVEVRRIERLARDPKFLRRVFTPRELAYCLSRRRRAEHLAVRFAAKEAVWKAFGREQISHREIEVENRSDGRPQVRLPRRLAAAARKLDLSLSHTKDYALAVAILK